MDVHSSFSHSATGGHVSCFQLLTIMDKVVIDIRVHSFV